tara:strand:- start:1272 stop:1559 length:288 start_codon:yes stop_codon:yes gene_type:complete
VKKVFLILLFGFLFSGNAYSEIKVMDEFIYKSKEIKGVRKPQFSIHTMCIDGYKFVTTYEKAKRGKVGMGIASVSVNTIQFMIAENGKMIPAKCD